MQTTIFVFTIARRDSDSETYSAIATGYEQRDAIARLVQDGLDRKLASKLVEQAKLSAMRPGARLVDGDVFEHVHAGPRRESYKLRATSLRIDPIGDVERVVDDIELADDELADVESKPAALATSYETGNGQRVVPVVVAGGSRIVHAGRQSGTYASGSPRYRKMCASSGRDNHDPMPVADDTPVSCKRCLAKMQRAS